MWYHVGGSKKGKRLQAIKANPKVVRPDDLFAALREDGWELDHVTGSHHQWRKEGVGRLSIPYRRPHLKKEYVEQALAFLSREENDHEEQK